MKLLRNLSTQWEQLIQHTESSASLSYCRKAVILVFGTTIILIGLAMIILPGPAIVVIPCGVAVLALEFVWAKRLLNRIQETFSSLVSQADSVQAKSPHDSQPPKSP